MKYVLCLLGCVFLLASCDRIQPINTVTAPIEEPAIFSTSTISPILIVEGYTRYVPINDLFSSIHPLTVTAHSEDKMVAIATVQSKDFLITATGAGQTKIKVSAYSKRGSGSTSIRVIVVASK